jgi:hypothetical protein
VVAVVHAIAPEAQGPASIDVIDLDQLSAEVDPCPSHRKLARFWDVGVFFVLGLEV